MDRRQALAAIQKATIGTTVGAGGLLSDAQSKAFIQTIKDRSSFGNAIRLERRRAPAGEINKLTSGSRLIRSKSENADDGYRAEVSFPTVSYATKKWWLPWEVTEDELRENIEGESAEAKIMDEMTQQFALDWDDLDINGDEDSADAFLGINDGLLDLCSTNTSGDIHRIDGSAINSGAINKAHFFEGKYKMPNKYVNSGRLRWFMSPNRWISWIEALTDRATGGGDAALNGQAINPLGIPPFIGASSEGGSAMPGVPAFPDDRIILADPNNFIRVVSWDVRRKKVTGETDWELATRDKRGYLYFVKPDFIIAEDDAVVDIHSLTAV